MDVLTIYNNGFSQGIFIFLIIFLTYCIGIWIGARHKGNKKEKEMKEEADESYHYRKHLTNLLVAGKIQQKAEKEGISLTEEQDLFEVIRSSDRNFDLDDKIEQELLNEE